jgi:hypothetical protein
MNFEFSARLLDLKEKAREFKAGRIRAEHHPLLVHGALDIFAALPSD